MAYISFQPSDFFNTVLYTGDGNNGRTVTGLGFQPDWTWIKSRNRSDVDHILNDSTRGAGKNIYSNATYPEDTSTNKIVSFDSDGLTLNSHVSVNGSADTYVAWNWKVNGGTTSSNTDGSITSTVQANTTSGFSVVTYTGTTGGLTVGHGLGTTPKVVLYKRRDSADNWIYWTTQIDGSYDYLVLNSTNAKTDSTAQIFTSSTFIDTGGVAGTFVAYCFAEIKGYSKFGSYTGNGSTNGTFVYTGFRPAFVMVKRTDAANNWDITTGAVSSNQINQRLRANLINAEENTGYVDFLSNGFKMRNTNSSQNASGGTYLYMAFAEFPLVGSNGLAGTAR
jgi:hypothetical protein